MARQGIKGGDIALQARFYENESLFNPFSVTSSVGIYDASTGGDLVATITAATTASGIWEATWSIPSDQVATTYYDEWTWQSLSTESEIVQRNAFAVGSNFVLSPTGNTLSLERRLQVIETAINEIAEALNNVPTKKLITSWQTLFQRTINELDQKIDTHEAVGH